MFAILGIMQLGGYLHRQRSDLDSRVDYLEPSAEFVEIVEGLNQHILHIIDAVEPAARLADAHATVPRFVWIMRKIGAETLRDGWKLLDPFPEVDHFVSRDGG